MDRARTMTEGLSHVAGLDDGATATRVAATIRETRRLVVHSWEKLVACAGAPLAANCCAPLLSRCRSSVAHGARRANLRPALALFLALHLLLLPGCECCGIPCVVSASGRRFPRLSRLDWLPLRSIARLRSAGVVVDVTPVRPKFPMFHFTLSSSGVFLI